MLNGYKKKECCKVRVEEIIELRVEFILRWDKIKYIYMMGESIKEEER